MRKAILIAVGVVLLLCVAFTSATPIGRGLMNTWFFNVQKVDDTTRYETRKKVEDTCRAMISSHEADGLAYMQYKDSANAEKQSWAEQAKMRANKTASTYNNYVLKNSFVWQGNIPDDIRGTLDFIE